MRLSMETRPHVLLIGTSGPFDCLRGCYLEEHGCVLNVVPTCLEIYQSVVFEHCEVAVFLDSLSEREFVETAHFIRRRWPLARILIVRLEEWWIDDTLYDERVVPGINPLSLLLAIERLAMNVSSEDVFPNRKPYNFAESKRGKEIERCA
jgi:hypothetical protein